MFTVTFNDSGGSSVVVPRVSSINMIFDQQTNSPVVVLNGGIGGGGQINGGMRFPVVPNAAGNPPAGRYELTSVQF